MALTPVFHSDERRYPPVQMSSPPEGTEYTDTIGDMPMKVLPSAVRCAAASLCQNSFRANASPALIILFLNVIFVDLLLIFGKDNYFNTQNY